MIPKGLNNFALEQPTPSCSFVPDHPSSSPGSSPPRPAAARARQPACHKGISRCANSVQRMTRYPWTAQPGLLCTKLLEVLRRPELQLRCALEILSILRCGWPSACKEWHEFGIDA